MRNDPEPQAAADLDPTGERLVRYLVERGVITRRGPETDAIRVIAAVPPQCLRVPVVAAVLSMSKRTLYRLFRYAGLPSARDWIALVRAFRTHGAILKGRPLKGAAAAGGYPDPFTMSNAIHRATVSSGRIARHRLDAAGRRLDRPTAASRCSHGAVGGSVERVGDIRAELGDLPTAQIVVRGLMLVGIAAQHC